MGLSNEQSAIDEEALKPLPHEPEPPYVCFDQAGAHAIGYGLVMLRGIEPARLLRDGGDGVVGRLRRRGHSDPA